MRRDWQFLGEIDEDDEFVEHDRDRVRQLLMDLEGTIHQIGGVMTMSAIRQQTGDDSYVTTGMLVSYDSFSPAARRPTPSDEIPDSPEPIEPGGDVIDGQRVDEIPPVEDAAT